jgi:hypothetical protein
MTRVEVEIYIMNEWKHNLYITGTADRIDGIAYHDPYRPNEPPEDLGTDAYGNTTIIHSFLIKGFALGLEALNELVDRYHTEGVHFYLLAYYCGCYWMDYEPDPFMYSYSFAEAYTAIPDAVTSVFLPGQGVIEQRGDITIRSNRNQMVHADGSVTEVLFRDWSRGTLVSKIVPESELFQELYGDGGDGVYVDPVRGRVVPIPEATGDAR